MTAVADEPPERATNEDEAGDEGGPVTARGVEPEIRIVVVTFNSGEVLGTFLDSLAKATARPYEVVVVDNSPALDAGTASAAYRPEVRLLRPGRNIGYGSAANRGAFAATAPWLLVANADVSFSPGAIDEVVDAAARWPRAGAFGPGIVDPAGGLYPSARDLPSLGRGIGHALFGWCWPTNPWTASYRRERGEPAEATAGWLSGSCQLMRREAFVDVGGFDESYFMFMEDVDLNRRMGLAGWQMVYVPSAVVEHVGGHSTKRLSRRMMYAHHRSMLRYLSRQYSGPLLLPLRALLAVGLTLRLLAAVLFAESSAGARTTRSAAALGQPSADPADPAERPGSADPADPRERPGSAAVPDHRTMPHPSAGTAAAATAVEPAGTAGLAETPRVSPFPTV